MVIICADDIPFVQDGTRLTDEDRRKTQVQIITELTKRKIGCIIVSGSVEERVSQVKDIILDKFGIEV